jgi:hypothetical protein
MTLTAFLRLPGAVILLTATAGLASAQNNPAPVLLPDQHPSHEGVLPCKAGTNFETDKYKITNVTVDDPFKFLYWIGGKSRNIEAQLDAMLKNQLFSYTLVDQEALSLIAQARFAPDSKNSFAVSIELVSVQNCDPNARTLDLIYRVYSTDPPQVLGGGTESQVTAEKSPQTIAGLAQAGNPFHFTPSGGYNRSYGMFGGGRIRFTPKLAGFHLFDTFTAEGQGSSSIRTFSASLTGSANFSGWIKHADWRLNYTNDSVPAGVTRLENADLSGQIDGQTRPFWNGSFLARFGGLLQGGNMQSASLPAGLLPPQTVPSAGYGSFKGYIGLSSRTTHNVFSVSYGLELGYVGPSLQVDWRKQIGDVVDEYWIPIGDHKPLEVESRFTFGGIQIPHSIPLSARFFGGNAEEFFVPGDSWQIRDEPMIRAIPANRFYLTSQGAGADMFKSINLTIAYPVKSHPIMPKDLSTDPEFDELLKAQIASAASVEQNYYAWKDPHFSGAMSKLPELKQELDALQMAVNAAQANEPDKLHTEFTDCSTSIETAAFDVTNTLAAKGIAQYGDLSALLPVDTDDLGSVQSTCVGELNQQLNDSQVRTAAAAVDSARTIMLTDFNGIDQKVAAKKADNDIAFVNRTLNTLFKDLNLYSVSPVAVFDAASIGPSKGALGGNRIGPGGGIRLELASSMDFTIGYAWNVYHQPGEGNGALFFSINVRDLFH